MRNRNHLGAALFLILAWAGIASAQQAPRVITVVPNGLDIAIPLTAADMGRDIVIVGESTNKREIIVEVGLGGAPGVIGTVLTTSVGAGVQVSGLNFYSGWSIVQVPNTQLIVGTTNAPPTPTPGSSSCFDGLDQNTINFLHSLYPNLSDAQICLILSGGGVPTPTPVPQFGSLTEGSGVVLRDACASSSKLAIQLRISTAGQPASLFDGTKSLHAYLKLDKGLNAGAAKYLRIKPPEGMDRGKTSAILLSPAIAYGWENKYGGAGNDTMVFQTYRDGRALSTNTEKCRPLWGSTTYSIAKAGKYIDKRKDLSITVKNANVPGGEYNYCIPKGSKNRCTKAYAKRHGIRCSGL